MTEVPAVAAVDDPAFDDALVGLMCVYEEEDLLPMALASLEPVVDRIIAADGRYSMYPGEGGPSRDSTLEVLDQAGADIIESPKDGWPTEHDKRSALVQHPSLRLGNELLVLDADERLVVPNPARVRELYGDFQLWVTGRDGTPGRQQHVRLFMYRPGLHYRFHFGLFTAGNKPVLRGRDQLPEDLVAIDHLHSLRSDEREARDKQYEARLVPFERELGAYGGR